MTKDRRSLAAVTILLTVSAVLSACASGHDAKPSVAPTASQPPALQVLPVSAFELGCADLVSDDLISSVLGPHGAPLTSPRVRADVYGTARAAILQDGGVMCEWPSLDGAGGGVPALSVVALPNASELFARALPGLLSSPAPWSPRYTQFDHFDATLVRCDDGYVPLGNVCAWQVMVGDVWLALQLAHVPAADVVVPTVREDPVLGRLPLTPVVDGSASFGLVSEVVEAFAGALRVEIEGPDDSLPSCAALAGAEDRFRVPEEYESQVAAPWGFSMWAYSVERQGHRSCDVSDQSGAFNGQGARFTVMRDMGWLLKSPFGTRDGAVHSEVDGLGSVYTTCEQSEDGDHCLVTVVRDNLMVVLDAGGSLDPAYALEVASTILAAAG